MHLTEQSGGTLFEYIDRDFFFTVFRELPLFDGKREVRRSSFEEKPTPKCHHPEQGVEDYTLANHEKI